jgi:hypothetical protein
MSDEGGLACRGPCEPACLLLDLRGGEGRLS